MYPAKFQLSKYLQLGCFDVYVTKCPKNLYYAHNEHLSMFG